MQLPKPHRIQTKFFAGLVAISLLLGLAFSLGLFLHTRGLLEEEVRDKARLIFSQADAVQHYVRDVLRPTMYERLPEAFVIQAMSSSYVSRKVMASVSAPEAGTVYRRAAMDARNPEYEANGLERELITYFREHSGQDLWQGKKQINGEKYYLMVRPVRFERECMYCHGRPEDAPAELLERYGNRGFGKELGAIAGVDFVGISVHGSVGRVERAILLFLALFALAVLLFFFSANLLFRVLVVNNLKRLNVVFRRNVTDLEGSALLKQLEQGDEIDELVDGMERMGEHLFGARRQLQHYAENLKRMVDERTDALSGEVDARRADVRLFVRLLEDMYRSRSRAELWRRVLPAICERFAARRITYVCTMGSRGFFSWPESDPDPELPPDYVDILTGGRCVASGSRLYVPVESGSSNAEGLLILDWPTEEAARHDRDVLQAVGRQLGIAAENLSAIDDLFRQMSILQAIVEGISDPLVLMDAGCLVLTANRAARRLTAELTGNERSDGNILALFFDLADSGCPMRETLARGIPDQREVGLADGRSFALALYPVRGREGATGQVVVYLRETTTEKRMQQQVWQAEKMATVGKLTAGLAHEINNPLGVILCYAGLLRQSSVDPQQVADVEIIERHTRQAQHVLQDLLNFARPKTTGEGRTELGAAAASLVEVFSAQAARKGVRISLECAETPLVVRLSAGELEQVASNLLINALDAVPEQDGLIRVRVAAEADGMAVLEVADNGPGVDEADRSRLFDPFYTTKEVSAGTGLGLSIVYGVVSGADGSVVIGRCERLGGARFLVRLRLAETAAEPASALTGAG